MSEDLQAKITDIQARFANDLMEKAHVVGVGVGMAKVSGEYTQEMALIVMVEQKIPEAELDPQDQIPHTIEGVRVDVQEVGTIQTF